MPIEIQDVLKTNVVLAGIALLEGQDERDAFVDSVDTEVVSEMFVPSPTPPAQAIGGNTSVADTALVLTLHRDRIQILTVPSRTSIERQYPSYEDLARLAEIAQYAINNTDLRKQELIAFGYNIDLVYRISDEKPADSYIAERLFSNKTLGEEDWTLVGGSGQFAFEGNNALWNITVEPRANDPSGRRVFLTLNLHKSVQEIPSQEEILTSLQEIWERSRSFATQLDKSI